MSIAKYIEAHYPQVLQFDIESINIDSKDIKRLLGKVGTT